MSKINIDNKRKDRKRRRRGIRNRIMATLFTVFTFIRYYLDLLIDKIFSIYYNDNAKQAIPPVTDQIITKSAVELARLIRKKELTSEEVVHAFIKRIKQINPILNAVVDTRFEEALKEARQIDLDIATGQIIDADFASKPFLGVPFTTKETTSVKGMAFTFGIVKRKDQKAKQDAECIKLMKEAGAICLGVTNVPQLNMWQETSNPVYGLTKNPYNTTRNVGGSSGGEASNLAAAGAPFGIGSDIGGSIRIPSFMCGVFGHKPTTYLISIKGLTFRTGNEKQTMVVVGPLTRHAEDLLPLLKVLTGVNANKLRLDHPVDVKKLKFYYIADPKDPFVSPMREDVKSAFFKVINYYNEVLPTPPQALNLSGTRFGGKLWRYWMTQEDGTNFRNDVNNREGELGILSSIILHLMGKSDLTTATIFNMINNNVLPKVDEKWALTETDKLKLAFKEILGEDGVLLYPSAPFPASYHHASYLRPWNFNYFCIWNALQMPVTQVPLGLSEKENLPVGIQVVANSYQDRLCLAVAKDLEQQFCGYVPDRKSVV